VSRLNVAPLPTSKLFTVKSARCLLLFLWVSSALGQSLPGARDSSQALAGQALLERALSNEVAAAQDTSHPARYELHKTSPRYATTKIILETKDGEVAHLIAVNDKPLSPEDEQREWSRLNGLLNDPGKQRHRKQAEDEDSARATKVLRALPSAFTYKFTESGQGVDGPIDKFNFQPNSSFTPGDLETQILTQMTGEIWIDPVHERVVRLTGHLQQDVDFGWGILGRLNKGGWIAIDQADVGDGLWHIVHFQMVMSGRIVFRTRVFDTREDESNFSTLPVGLSYQRAIEILQSESGNHQSSSARHTPQEKGVTAKGDALIPSIRAEN
jgi:hypothetical protein